MADETKKTADNAGGEYERQPVPQHALLGFKSFVGMFAGEHTAGTELMIGPLFIAAGVSAFDFLMGLLVGNLLAVLSWTFFCAPIATRVRLTMYYQLEKICGRKLVVIYDLANGVMFTILAGAMITVAATAFGVWFKFPMPGLGDMYPNSVGWVVAVLAVGVFVAVVAAAGYRTVAKIANLAAPWMVLVFLAFGVITFRQFLDATQTPVHSLSDVWTMCKTVIWKGGDPLPGQTKFTFWHVMFFAWFCNMAWHIGMSDLSIFRYAKKSWYGIASGAGMYLGHFLAWICASLLFAYQLHTTPENTSVLPGPMTYRVAGITGLICVILASWTTANPTLYRAGLAFQAIMPKFSRFSVTLVLGLIAAVAGMFPAVVMKLLDFVAMWGMILMPMGAVIFVDFWLMRKFGLKSNYAELSGKAFNWAAGLAWFITMGVCWWLVYTGRIQIYFVSLPGWFVTAILYVVFSAVYQSRVHETSVIRAAAKTIGWLSLAALILMAILYLAGTVDIAAAKKWMLILTVVWFVAASLWMWDEKK
jgi:purine-cytosine permease-like protein